MFSMFVHRWFHPDAQTGKIAWDQYDGGNRDILEAWLNWNRRAKKVRLEPSIYKRLVNRGWAKAERPKRARNVLSRNRKEDFYAREYPSIRRVSLTAEGREKFLELVDRATHLTKMEKDPDYPEALFLKAQVLWDGFEDYSGTRQCLQRVMEVSPDENAAFHRWAVRMYEEMHKITTDRRRSAQTDPGFFECGSGNQPSLKLWLTSSECGNKNRAKRKEV